MYSTYTKCIYMYCIHVQVCVVGGNLSLLSVSDLVSELPVREKQQSLLQQSNYVTKTSIYIVRSSQHWKLCIYKLKIVHLDPLYIQAYMYISTKIHNFMWIVHVHVYTTHPKKETKTRCVNVVCVYALMYPLYVQPYLSPGASVSWNLDKDIGIWQVKRVVSYLMSND